MHRILFVCHGNICRSTMAQFVMADLVRRAGRAGEFAIDSAATTREELGNPPHPGTCRKLRAEGVPVGAHRARQVRREEYGDWDLVVCMDEENVRDLGRILGGDLAGKVRKLMEFAPAAGGMPVAAGARDVADPWYTGDFDATYRDVLAGCTGLLAALCGTKGTEGIVSPQLTRN